MSQSQTPTPDEARASLDQIDATRRAAADATRRPVWIDVGLAVTVGLAFGLGAARQWLLALLILVAGSMLFTIAQRRRARGHGQILDQRAVWTRMLSFAVLYGVVFFAQLIGPADWQPWYSIGLGLLAAAGGFVWLRWEDHYRIKRLSAGDYDRYDLL